MYHINLDGFNARNTEKLEAFLREHRDADNFSVAIICRWRELSNDFLREFKDEFVIMANRYLNQKYQFKYKEEHFYKELFGEK